MTFPRYAEYKDSGIEWLGEVPGHWAVMRLKRVAAIQYGIGEPPKYNEEGTPLIRATNVDAGRIRRKGLVFVDPADIPANRITWLAPGDIIVVRSGAYTGDSAIIRSEHCPSIAGFDMVLHPDGCYSDFLQYALLSRYLKSHQIDLEKLRAAQPHLNAEELGSCLLLLPPPSEQASIAAFLDRETAKIDALVAEQEKLIALLAEKRQAVISHAVTKGLDPAAPLKDSGIEWLGEVPEHWEVKRLKHILREIVQGWSPEAIDCLAAEGEWGVLKTGCVNYGVFRDTEHKALPPGIEPPPDLEVKPGDILMSRASGSTELIGSVALVESCEYRLFLSDKIFRLEVAPDHCSERFLVRMMGSVILRMQIAQSISGAEGLANNIGKAAIRAFWVAVPPIEEQKAIADFLDAETARLDALTAEARRAIDLLKEHRSALISAAVTGKIDVRGLVKAEAA
ncbi:MAG: restriction endonuclease subunit S [Ignavibacteriales bacterium]